MKAFAYMYHPVLAPYGKLMNAGDCAEYESEGWVDTPEKFKKSTKKGKSTGKKKNPTKPSS